MEGFFLPFPYAKLYNSMVAIFVFLEEAFYICFIGSYVKLCLTVVAILNQNKKKDYSIQVCFNFLVAS